VSKHKHDERFLDTVYFVEATSFELQILWQRNDAKKRRNRVKWEEDLRGLFLVIGDFYGRPVTVRFSFAKLNGKRVCFYEASSQVVNYEMVREFLEKECGVSGHCDAQNFHLCLAAVEHNPREVIKESDEATP